VKFHWFHLMPWPHLPDDFQEKHRSVWVDVDYNLFDPVKGHHVYNEYLDELEYAERCGFDGICCNEHHSNAYGLMPSPNLIAAALARRTERAALVVLGNSIALYNPPIRVAEEFAMLDIISGGRLVAGFPVGTSMDTNFAYGVTPATLRERYYEAHDLILQCWTRKDTFHFNGKYTQVRYVNPWPRPLQQPHPPIWIPGGGSLETWDWTTEKNYLYCYLSYFGYIRGKAVMDNFWRRVEELGGDDNPYRAGFLQLVCVADSDAEAERLYAEHVSYFYNRCLHVYTGFADAPGYRTLKTVRAGIRAQVRAAASELSARTSVLEGLSWSKGYVIAGSPDSRRPAARRAHQDACASATSCCLMQIGNMPREKVLLQHEALRREGDAALAGQVQGVRGPLVPEAAAEGASRPPAAAA
jgi:alkanesulfonate monooxygenase SsuD/methylene tetrahydromethanopterin reductase-like flavin-dependent oxidoreductase (luciferase family)